MIRTVIFVPRGSACADAKRTAIALRDEVLRAARDLDPQRTAVIDAPDDMSMALIDCSACVADKLKQQFPAATIAPERYLSAPKPAPVKFRI